MSEPRPVTLLDIPGEMLEAIAISLSLRDACSLMQTCKILQSALGGGRLLRLPVWRPHLETRLETMVMQRRTTALRSLGWRWWDVLEPAKADALIRLGTSGWCTSSHLRIVSLLMPVRCYQLRLTHTEDLSSFVQRLRDEEGDDSAEWAKFNEGRPLELPSDGILTSAPQFDVYGEVFRVDNTRGERQEPRNPRPLAGDSWAVLCCN